MEERQGGRWATRAPDRPSVVIASSRDPHIQTELIDLVTSAANEFWDLTERVIAAVNRSQVRWGQVTVHTPHTSTTLVVNEAETGFLNDFRRLIDSHVPEDAYYEHDDLTLRTENLNEDEFVNGHAHCRALLVGQTSVTIPIVAGELLLGQWQRVMFVELDQGRNRRAFVHVQGA